MKERPILFSVPMVRALLEGRKTQTRRVVKGEILSDATGAPYEMEIQPRCPYGAPGDRLWVRETHQRCNGCKHVNYLADEQQHGECSLCGEGLGKWKPSIFMRRELSRLTPEVVSVRVERLQDITEADAIAEGCDDFVLVDGVKMWRSAVEAYGELWDRINGEGAWNLNPWVWVVEFKVSGEEAV